MATEASLIVSVRRRVADLAVSPAVPKYADSFYQDAINFGLQKLTHDQGTLTTLTVASLTSTQEFLLVKLATIEMCYMRAAEGAEGEGTEGEATRFTSISVPDLSLTDGNQGASRGPAFWMDLAKRLQAEYDSEITLDQTYPEVEQTFTHRLSGIHGGYRVRKVDPGLPAVAITTTVVGSEVVLAWTKILHMAFARYEIYRGRAATMSDEECVASEYDNHVEEYIDTGLTAGTYYYRIKTVNPNEIRTNSNIASAVVT